MSDRQFESSVRAWLEAGSDRTPPPAIDAVLLAVKTTPQERDLRIPRRINQMTNSMRLVVAVAIVVVAGLGALTFLNPGPGGPPPATTPPSDPPTAAHSRAPSAAAEIPLPTGPVSTEGWVPFVSDRYGFTISHPVDWVATPADHDWRLPEDADWRSTGAESFVGAPLRVSAWSVAVDPGTSADAWIAAYCSLSTGPCSALRDRAVSVSLDGHPGTLSPFESDAQAFFLVEDRMYVFAAWRPGARHYLEGFLSTVDLLPGGPTPAGTGAPPAS